MKTEVVTITPLEARKILDKSPGNFRKPSDRIVTKYAEDMKASRWKLNGVPLLFSCNGSCIDGQHRLLACIKANEPFTTMTVHGIQSCSGVDDGFNRSAASWLANDGCTMSKDIASATRLLLLHEHGGIRKRRKSFSNEMILERFHTSEEVIYDAVRLTTHQRVIPRSLLGFILIVGTKAFDKPSDSQQANTFVSGIKDGANLDEHDPRLALRNRLLNVGPLHRLDVTSQRAIAIIGWNKFVQNSAAKMIHWKTDGKSKEDFPSIAQATF